MPVPGEVKIFDPLTVELVTLFDGIHRHATRLPEFQRGWVWEPEMVRDLIVSVANRYPAGTLLTMPIGAGSFALRTFEGSGEAAPGQNATLMVLDGQQRLTSLYQALYRREGVQWRGRAFHFYLDVAFLLHDQAHEALADGLFASALFYVVDDRKTGRRVRYDRLQPRYEITTRELQLAAGALPMALSFALNDGVGDWKTAYLTRLANGDMERFIELNTQWDQRVGPWLNAIRTYPFPVVQLRADMPLGAICHIFEKVNSTGVPLDVFELCTAILWAQGFQLNAEWTKTRQSMDRDRLLPMQPRPLSGTYFLQAISLLDSLDRKRARPGERIAVTARKEDLMALNVAQVQRWWPVLVRGYRAASSFLLDQGVISDRILPYTTLIMPLSAMFADIIVRKGEAHTGGAWAKIAQWYWCSVFSQRYSSQTESAAAQDIEQVMAWVDGTGPAPDVVQTFTFRAEALQEITSIRNAVYKGVLCLLAREGAKDFGGGAALTTALFFDERHDHHHIFPTEALRGLGIVDPRADSILNKTLISAAVNRSIGGNAPSKYLAKLAATLGEPMLDSILQSHGISPAALRQDDWQTFAQDRRERLRALVLNACGGGVGEFGDSAQVSEDLLLAIEPAADEEEAIGA